MPAWLQDWPVLWVYLFFVFGALARSQALYWLGRGVAAGVLRTRWTARLDNPQVRKATRTIERWGMPIVPVSLLTVGFQSAVLSASGLLRLEWLRFTLWVIPGALVWAALWGAGGTTLAAGLLALAQESPWALAPAVMVLAVLVVLTVLFTRRVRATRAEAPDTAS
jgi:membrane protein DedA with SNARE-associated domain